MTEDLPGFNVHPIQQVFTVIPDRAFPELVGKVVDDFKIDFFSFSGLILEGLELCFCDEGL